MLTPQNQLLQLSFLLLLQWLCVFNDLIVPCFVTTSMKPQSSVSVLLFPLCDNTSFASLSSCASSLSIILKPSIVVLTQTSSSSSSCQDQVTSLSSPFFVVSAMASTTLTPSSQNSSCANAIFCFDGHTMFLNQLTTIFHHSSCAID